MEEIYSIWDYRHLRKGDRVINPVILKFNTQAEVIYVEEQTNINFRTPTDLQDIVQRCLALPPIVGEEEYLFQITEPE